MENGADLAGPEAGIRIASAAIGADAINNLRGANIRLTAMEPRYLGAGENPNPLYLLGLSQITIPY
jgi:hypothetical protein